MKVTAEGITVHIRDAIELHAGQVTKTLVQQAENMEALRTRTGAIETTNARTVQEMQNALTSLRMELRQQQQHTNATMEAIKTAVENQAQSLSGSSGSATQQAQFPSKNGGSAARSNPFFFNISSAAASADPWAADGADPWSQWFAGFPGAGSGVPNVAAAAAVGGTAKHSTSHSAGAVG